MVGGAWWRYLTRSSKGKWGNVKDKKGQVVAHEAINIFLFSLDCVSWSINVCEDSRDGSVFRFFWYW